MKKVISFILIAFAFACTSNEDTKIVVKNSLHYNRANEMVEVPVSQLPAHLIKSGQFILSGPDGNELPWQITHDNLLIFQATTPASGESIYTIKKGTPSQPEVLTYGKHYPERVDDIAWENDRIAFRTYGPALQATGERAFGYDIWVKRVSHLVVEDRYNTELNPETRAKIAELRKTDPKAANELANSVSYHIDHGNGLDYYSVGPTLGAGTSALLDGDQIVYPYCYNTYEILDNGPLRFTVRLTYHPFTCGDDNQVTETRIISLDAGSQLNKATITFDNLSAAVPIVTGIVMHSGSNVYHIDKNAGALAYADPKDPVNGQTFIGTVLPQNVDLLKAEAIYFDEKEKADRKAEGHLSAISIYQPGSQYTYYFGGGWSKWGFDTIDDWFTYLCDFALEKHNPLTVSVK